MPDRDAELALLRLAWRVDALDKWRDSIDNQLAVLREEIDGVTEAQKIAEGVAARLTSTSAPVNVKTGLSLTWYQRLGALIAGALILADAVRGLVS